MWKIRVGGFGETVMERIIPERYAGGESGRGIKGGVARCRKEDIDKVRNFNGYQTFHFTATLHCLFC